MTELRATVFVVDDDPSVLKSLGRLLRSAGYEAVTFDSSEEFLKTHDPGVPGCAVLDVAMPSLSGLDILHALRATGSGRPVVFLTGREGIPASDRAMIEGAVEFLTKPVRGEQLLSVIEVALARDVAARAEAKDLQRGPQPSSSSDAAGAETTLRGG